MNLNILELIKKAENTHNLSKDEIVSILVKNKINNELFKAADRVREKYVGNEVHLRGLMEFSNICSKNCFYCGLRRDNRNLTRYKLEPNEIISLAKNAVNLGYKTLVLQSGEGNMYSNNEMIYIISEIKKLSVAITLSIGEKSQTEYEMYKKAGADRFLLRIETTDKELYKKLHPGMDHENRINCLKVIKKLGYETGTGSLVGLPNQTFESIAEDILFFKEIQADMIGLGPFIPNQDTPLKNANIGSFETALEVMSIVRLLMPDVNIPATTAMETLHTNGRLIALQSGANVIMPNVTDVKYKTLYKLYPDKANVYENPDESKDNVSNNIKSIGRTISTGYGFKKT